MPDIAVIGGAGHAGLPLAITFANRSRRVLIQDLNAESLALLREGRMPFDDRGAPELLRRALDQDTLSFSTDGAAIRGVPNIIITIGTPVDEFANPVLWGIENCLHGLLPHFSDGQLLVLRSTVYPGVTDWLDRYLKAKGKHLLVAFCPERIVQGFGVEELQKLPQIVSATTPEARRRAAELFGTIAPKVVELTPMEAEFAKLFNNTYRYLHFAITNQFYMIADAAGVDYSRVLDAMKKDYPRSRDVPDPGYSAGPCLYKDTVQLAAFSGNHFSLGQDAILVNEGLPTYVLSRLEERHRLADKTVGLLGMAFKADSDDARCSLSYKFKKLLQFRAKCVLTTDPYVRTDPDLLPLKKVVAESDILIVCTPHSTYKGLDCGGKIVFDIWNLNCGRSE